MGPEYRKNPGQWVLTIVFAYWYYVGDMTIAQALSEAAANAKIHDVQIAARLGVSQGTVALWRAGKKTPRSQYLIGLIEFVPGFGKLIGLELTAA